MKIKSENEDEVWKWRERLKMKIKSENEDKVWKWSISLKMKLNFIIEYHLKLVWILGPLAYDFFCLI